MLCQVQVLKKEDSARVRALAAKLLSDMQLDSNQLDMRSLFQVLSDERCVTLDKLNLAIDRICTLQNKSLSSNQIYIMHQYFLRLNSKQKSQCHNGQIRDELSSVFSDMDCIKTVQTVCDQLSSDGFGVLRFCEKALRRNLSCYERAYRQIRANVLPRGCTQPAHIDNILSVVQSKAF